MRTTDDDPDRVPRHARASTSRARCSASAPTAARSTTLGEVDVVCFLIDASEPIGRGDRFIADLVAAGADADRARRSTRSIGPVARAHRSSTSRSRRRSSASSRPSCRCRPAPARGSTRWSASSRPGCPPGPHYYPDGVVSDQPEAVLAAELLREKLLAADARRAAALDRRHHRGDRGARRPRTARCSRCAWSYASSATRRRGS